MSTPRKAAVWLCCLALAMAGGIAAANAQALTVGTHPTTPFGGPPPGGGYCVDLMTAVAERTGDQIEFTFIPVGEFFPALSGGTIDVLCSAIGPSNEQRSQGIAFTSSIFINNDALIVLATDATEYGTAADFVGQPVGAVTGTAYLGIWRDAGVTDVREFPVVTDAYTALRNGEINAIITGGPGVAYRQQVLGQDADLRMVDTYVSTLNAYAALAVRAEETELLGRLQAALETLKGDGTIETLTTRWAMPLPPF
ncbi:MAG: substrate-binding periplasmic protein [Bauldia sp.]